MTTSTEPAEHTPDPTSTNPLISVGTITAVGSAVLAAAVAFGLHIGDDQQSAILAVIGVLAPIVVALWGRRKVYAPATVHRLLAARGRPRTELRGEHGPEIRVDLGGTPVVPFSRGRATPPDAGTIR